MACIDVERNRASAGGEESSGLAKDDFQERPPRELKDLLEALNQGISKLPLYNFEVAGKPSNPPLPQMILFDPNSNSAPTQSPAMIAPAPNLGPGVEHVKRYAMLNRMNSESSGNTTPPKELGKISKGGHICFLGPAGSGKTTLLRIIARSSVQGCDGYDKMDYVHIIHPGPFEGDSAKLKCLARHAIFSCNIDSPTHKYTDAESKELFDYALKHSRRFLLLIDSLDTLPQELNEIADPGSEYSHDRKYPALVHLKMLLCGKLLKGCRVVTSSRPHAIRNYKGDLIPSRVVSLVGFSEKDALEVLKLYSHNSEKISKIIKGRPHFFSLFKEPVFLVYLVQIWKALRSLDYMRATDVLIRVVSCFSESDHAKGNYEKLKEIKNLARGALWRRKFEFDETSLADYDLRFADLTDLCANASDESGKQIILKLTTGESPFMFSHQSIQEMFAALNVVESKFRKFEEKIGMIHDPFFHKTRDFVYGLVFGKSSRSDSEFPDINRKRDILKRSIELRFRRASPPEQLSIFETLTEAITDVGQFNLVTALGVNLSGIPMNDWSLYCTGVASSQFTLLQVLHLEACSIQLSHLRALKVGICRFHCHKLQILSFSLKNNAGIGKEKEAVEIACTIVRKCKVGDFNIGACGLNSDSMSEMLVGLRRTTVAVLGLEQNRIGKKGMEIAGTIVKQCSVKDINLSECATTFEEAKAFGISARGSDIHRLIVEHRNEKIVCGYGNVIRDCNLRILILLLSTLTPRDALVMTKYSLYGKISELQFSALINVTGPIPTNESNCESIRNLLPIVKDEITIPTPMASNLIENLQSSLDDLRTEGPVIKFPGTIKLFTLMSKKRQHPTGDDEYKRETSSAEEIDKQADTADEGEIAMEMETEYLNISKGSDTITWLKKYKKHPDLVASILAAYGLSIHRYKMNDEDTHLVAKILTHCSELRKFSFTYSTGLKPMLGALIKVSKEANTSLPKVTNACFAGYPGIDKELSGQFVKYVKLFKAEGLILTSVNASLQGLQALKTDLKNFKQMKHFKRLEIFHNPDIGDEGWKCLADIAKDSYVPLALSTCYCDVKDGQLVAFKKAINSTQLGKIDVCGNRKLTKKGFQTLGEIVQHSEVPSVTLQDCNLDAEKVRAFNDGCGIESSSLMIASLNVANNPNLGCDGVEELKKTIRSFRVKNLNVASCRLDDVDFEHEFESLDISGNPKCESISKLAKTVRQRLYIRNCMLNTSELTNLATEMMKEQQKLEELDVSDASRQIDSDFIDFLVGLFKNVTECLTVADDITIPTSEEY